MMTNGLFDWVEAHIGDDPMKLRLKYAGKESDGFAVGDAITQIECRRKFGKKLSETLAAFPRFYFPSVLAGEQATSDLLASFHSSFVADGLPAVDLTSGLGIDAMHCAARASELIAVERDSPKVEALAYNATGLHIDNIRPVCDDCLHFIESCKATKRKFATAFIDPARRDTDGSRVFALSDCAPDVTAIMPSLAQICDLLIIKASPMLDISHTIGALGAKPLSVTAVGTPTECKELLITVDFDKAATDTETVIEAATLTPARGATTFAFTLAEEKACESPALSDITEGGYVYEPSPALMKTGAFKLIAKRFGLSVPHPNTHLFTSANLTEDFPGNTYRVVKVLPYASRVLKRFAREYPRINVAIRNFGMGADALRSKLGVADGGDLRLYGITTAQGDRQLLITEKISE